MNDSEKKFVCIPLIESVLRQIEPVTPAIIPHIQSQEDNYNIDFSSLHLVAESCDDISCTFLLSDVYLVIGRRCHKLSEATIAFTVLSKGAQDSRIHIPVEECHEIRDMKTVTD